MFTIFLLCNKTMSAKKEHKARENEMGGKDITPLSGLLLMFFTQKQMDIKLLRNIAN